MARQANSKKQCGERHRDKKESDRRRVVAVMGR